MTNPSSRRPRPPAGLVTLALAAVLASLASPRSRPAVGAEPPPAATVPPTRPSSPAGGAARGPASVPPVPVAFVPPPLRRAVYSLGIFDQRDGRLVRRLREAAPEKAFVVGDNGLVARWDRRDDAGRNLLTGRFVARGYAVGPWTVEGVAFHGNDWVDDDENLRVRHVEAIAAVPADDGLVALVVLADGTREFVRLAGGADHRLLWRAKASWPPPGPVPSLSPTSGPGSAPGPDPGPDPGPAAAAGPEPATALAVVPPGLVVAWTPGATLPAASCQLERGVPASFSGPLPAVAPDASPGRDGTTWKIDRGGALVQSGPGQEILRQLDVPAGQPRLRAVSAGVGTDTIYLLEEGEAGERVRALSWLETRDEGGRPVSTWKTVFEKNVRRPDPGTGLDDPRNAAAAGPAAAASSPVEVTLAANPLEPRGAAPARVRLRAAYDDRGSYLETADGLRLRKVSERSHLRAVRLVRAKGPGTGAGTVRLVFYQTDGAAWDEFAVDHVDRLMSFDAGEFELTPTGERSLDEGK